MIPEAVGEGIEADIAMKALRMDGEEGGVNGGIVEMDVAIRKTAVETAQRTDQLHLDLRLSVLVGEAPLVVARLEMPNQKRARWGWWEGSRMRGMKGM